jgi:hypothetical protein
MTCASVPFSATATTLSKQIDSAAAPWRENARLSPLAAENSAFSLRKPSTAPTNLREVPHHLL